MKEGQQATPKLLTQPSQSSPPLQVPPKHCGICSCNSHYTDECPQLQEDNVIASSHNYHDGPPQNCQYQQQSQEWRDNQQGRWNSNQQSQYRQPYNNNNPPRNSQNNTRYQPPHSRQRYPSNNNSQHSYEESFRLSQQENKKMREVAKRSEAQISHLTNLMTKFANQMLPSTSPPPPPPNPSPLPSQPLPNPKGGINVVEKGNEEKEKRKARTEWLIELIAKANEMVESDDEDWWDESDESDESDEEDSEEYDEE
ncbi:hypothetical protein PIB30_071242 [Stylosanthes scabra]|uniref:Uncharacterized protein n=1 Tax=Stylosanthes scabra TaxID=79078 RepID=A0ABU6UPS0_9FABA|nr:hypothetical protein [Stylosanthes scabra]